mmetsp:Transcript_30394/g.79744  ORF Transcript_30394/g.79744 Transcript_30394/m.79744 type:complete len:225 (+) Transcript_30394:1812-2486(+)
MLVTKSLPVDSRSSLSSTPALSAALSAACGVTAGSLPFSSAALASWAPSWSALCATAPFFAFLFAFLRTFLEGPLSASSAAAAESGAAATASGEVLETFFRKYARSDRSSSNAAPEALWLSPGPSPALPGPGRDPEEAAPAVGASSSLDANSTCTRREAVPALRGCTAATRTDRCPAAGATSSGLGAVARAFARPAACLSAPEASGGGCFAGWPLLACAVEPAA